MNKELNEDARTKQDLLYECSNLNSRLSNEIIKNVNLEQQCKKQKEVIDKVRNNLEKDISLIKTIKMSNKEIICRLEETNKMLKEVS